MGGLKRGRRLNCSENSINGYLFWVKEKLSYWLEIWGVLSSKLTISISKDQRSIFDLPILCEKNVGVFHISLEWVKKKKKSHQKPAPERRKRAENSGWNSTDPRRSRDTAGFREKSRDSTFWVTFLLDESRDLCGEAEVYLSRILVKFTYKPVTQQVLGAHRSSLQETRSWNECSQGETWEIWGSAQRTVGLASCCARPPCPLGPSAPGAASLPTLSLHTPHASMDVFKPHGHIPSLVLLSLKKNKYLKKKNIYVWFPSPMRPCELHLRKNMILKDFTSVEGRRTLW